MKLKDMLEGVHKLKLDARKIYDDAKAEDGRALTPAEKEKINRIIDDVNEQEDEMRVLAALEENEIEQVVNAKLAELAPRKVDTEELEESDSPRGKIASKEYRKAFDQYLRRGSQVLKAEEARALEEGTAAEGGNIVPEEFERRIIEIMLEINVMRPLCTVIETANDRNIPIETGHDSASWTDEEASITEDLSTGASKQTFGKVVLGAHKLTHLLKISDELLQDAAFDLEAYVARAVAKKFGEAEETAFVAGDGSGKPTGFMDATAGQIGVTAASHLVIAPDEIIDLFYSIKRIYRANSSFVMNDSTVKVIRKLKENATDEQYLWQPGLQSGEPDRLMGRPLYASPGAPEIGTGALVIAFGDFSYYWVADRLGRSIQRLNELYATNGQVAFLSKQRVDGKQLLDEAIKNLRMSPTT